MTILSGADVVLHDRILPAASIVIRDGVIEEVLPQRRPDSPETIDVAGRIILPGFIDVHVHGIEDVDVLDGLDAVASVAARLTRYGVTGFCPTSVACSPQRLTTLLRAIAAARAAAPSGARVLAAHLESNFINPAWNGAQPAACLRTADGAFGPPGAAAPSRAPEPFSARDVLRVIEQHRENVGIVTVAPELPGGLELVRWLSRLGIRVSLGHSGATYDEAKAAIDAGARHATHLFNRMSTMSARSPGVVGAVLESTDVFAEVICDGHHVHPSLITVAIRAKSIARLMAITDGTAAAGLAVGSRSRLGDQTIIAGNRTALLEDGTLAGSVLTMDGAFRMLVSLGLTLPEASRMCSGTPADALRLVGVGAIAAGNHADLVVMSRDGRVKQTYVAGRLMS